MKPCKDPLPQQAQSNNPINEQVQSSCLAIAESYQAGMKDKPMTILKLTKAILVNSDDNTASLVAFSAYCKMLDSFDKFRTGGLNCTNTADPWLQQMMHNKGRNSLAMLGTDQMKQTTMQQMLMTSLIPQGQSSI